MHKIHFVLIVLIIGSALSCKKDDAPKQPTTEYYFFGKLDSKEITLSIGTSNEIDMNNGNQISVSDSLCKADFGSIVVCTATGSTNPDEPDFGIQLLSYFNGPCTQIGQEFPSLFSTGTYGFGSGVGNIQVYMYDGTEYWISDPSKQPSGSFIEISRSEEAVWRNKPARKLVGKGSCVLFDSNGNSKKLDNIQFSVAIEKP